MSIYYQDSSVTLYHGKCEDVLATLSDASVDSVVTDPPYDRHRYIGERACADCLAAARVYRSEQRRRGCAS